MEFLLSHPFPVAAATGKGWGTEGSISSCQKTDRTSVIVGAAEVVAAVGADQFAVVAREAMTAGGADLAVVIDWQRFYSGDRHTTL